MTKSMTFLTNYQNIVYCISHNHTIYESFLVKSRLTSMSHHSWNIVSTFAWVSSALLYNFPILLQGNKVRIINGILAWVWIFQALNMDYLATLSHLELRVLLCRCAVRRRNNENIDQTNFSRRLPSTKAIISPEIHFGWLSPEKCIPAFWIPGT